MIKASVRWARAGLLAALSSALPAALPAQPGRPASKSVDEPAWRVVDVFRRSQGLPQATVLAILQTRDGYLWVGTKGGLTRFDGVRFSTYAETKEVSVTGYEIWALAEGHDGTLWLGAYGGGVGSVRDGVVQEHRARDGLVSDFVTALCEDTGGVLWIGTEKGLSSYSGSRFTTQGAAAVQALACDAQGGVWASGGNGALSHITRGGAERIALPAGRSAEVRSLARGADGALWMALSEGVLRQKDGVWTSLDVPGRSPHVYVGRDGQVWIGSGVGLFRLRDGAFVQYDVSVVGSEKQNVTALCGDHEGSLWIGHGGAGLVRVGRGSFVSYGRRDGLISPYVSAVLESGTGEIYVGTASGLNRYRQGRFEAITPPTATPLVVRSLAEDTDGELWVGTDTDVYRLRPREGCPDGRCVQDFAPVDRGGLPRLNARIIYKDRRGVMWVGTDRDGLVRYEGGRGALFTTKDGLADDGIRGFVEDATGSLWIGTKAGGLCRLQDGRFTSLTEKDGLASNQIQAVYCDGSGALWIATRSGVNRLKDGVFATFKTSDGLPASHVYGFAEDGLGNMWMSSDRGIFRAGMQELDDLARGKTRAVRPVTFGEEHGLTSTVASAGSFPTICRTRSGHLWFGTIDGLSVIDPARVSTNALPPAVHVEEARIDGVLYDVRRPAQAPPGRGSLDFRYTALSFMAPAKVRFKVRLEPYDKDWVDAGALRAMQYRNIPPGAYSFRVMAANNDGVWNGSGARVDLYLKPYFHQTYWAYALYLAAALAAVLLAHRLRVAQMRLRFGAVLDERTRIARELHDTLAQGLAGLGLQLDTLSRGLPPGAARAAEQLQLARAMVKSSLGEVRRSIWVLRAQSGKEHRGLADSVADDLRQLTAGTGLTTTVHIGGTPRVLKGEVERNVLRIAHEAVTNAVRHAAASNIAITLDFEETGLALRVEDDGRGFDASAQAGAAAGRRFGVIGMIERAESLGGRLEIGGRPAGGTCVRCFLPYAGSPDPIAADEGPGTVR